MPNNTFDAWEGEHLEHFGTKGMKWGTRRYQNPDGSLTPAGRERYGANGEGGSRKARGISRDLRRLEKERAGAQARADYYQKRSSKAVAKAGIKSARTGKDAKLNRKRQKFVDKAKAYQGVADRAKKMSDVAIKNALSKGYSVKSRDTLRFVRKGKDKALMAVGRIGTSVNSVKYKVKNDGLGRRTHKKSIGAINRRRHASNFVWGNI